MWGYLMILNINLDRSTVKAKYFCLIEALNIRFSDLVLEKMAYFLVTIFDKLNIYLNPPGL